MTYRNLIMAGELLELLMRDGTIADGSIGAVASVCVDLDFRASLISHERETPDDFALGVADAYALLGRGEDDPELIEFRRRMALPTGGRRPARK